MDRGGMSPWNRMTTREVRMIVYNSFLISFNITSDYEDFKNGAIANTMTALYRISVDTYNHDCNK